VANDDWGARSFRCRNIQSVFFDERGAGLIETDDFDADAVPLQFLDGLIERADRGDIPEMRVAEIDRDGFRCIEEIEGFDKGAGGVEEDLAVDEADDGFAIRRKLLFSGFSSSGSIRQANWVRDRSSERSWGRGLPAAFSAQDFSIRDWAG